MNEVSFYKDIDVIYEGGGYFTNFNENNYHYAFRIIFFENAYATLKINGVSYHIRPDMAIIIRPYCIYSIESYNKDIKYLDWNFLDKKSAYNTNVLFEKDFIIQVNKEDVFFYECFRQVIREHDKQRLSKILMLSGICFVLLSFVFRKLRDIKYNSISNKAVSRSNIFLLSEIEHALNSDFKNNSKISNLAFEVGISENKLYKVIKDTYMMSPKEWIMNIKMQKIRIMLIERYTLYDIASKLGFSSVSHMGSVFKKNMGLTLNEFLKDNSNK